MELKRWKKTVFEIGENIGVLLRMRKVSEIMTYREAIEFRKALRSVGFDLNRSHTISDLENLLGSTLKQDFDKNRDLIQLIRKYLDRNQEDTPILIERPLKLENCCTWYDCFHFLKKYRDEFRMFKGSSDVVFSHKCSVMKLHYALFVMISEGSYKKSDEKKTFSNLLNMWLKCANWLERPKIII